MHWPLTTHAWAASVLYNNIKKTALQTEIYNLKETGTEDGGVKLQMSFTLLHYQTNFTIHLKLYC